MLQFGRVESVRILLLLLFVLGLSEEVLAFELAVNTSKSIREAPEAYNRTKQSRSHWGRQLKIFATLKSLFNFKRRICYDDDGIGCFDLNNPQTFRLAHCGKLPDSPAYVNVAYEFTAPMSAKGIRYSYRTSPKTLQFDPSLPLKVVIHGMGNSIDTSWIRALADAFLNKLPQNNLILVDWSQGASINHFNRPYSLGVANVELVGRIVGNYLIAIHDEVGIPYSGMHIIGLSFGAQVAGIAGAWIKDKLNDGTQVGRISGMDPAFPLFGEKTYSEEQQRFYSLDSSDAEFVDIIHTNMGDVSVFKSQGQNRALGHVDFIMNGGESQPDCSQKLVFGYLVEFITGATGRPCSHIRSLFYYTESISKYPDCEYISTGGCGSYAEFSDGDCFVVGSDATRASRAGFYAYQYPGRGLHHVKIVPQPEEALTGFCGFSYLLELDIHSAQKTVPGTIVALNNYQLVSSSKWKNFIYGGQTYKTVIVSSTETIQSISLTVTLLGKPLILPQTILIDEARIRDRTGSVKWRTCGNEPFVVSGSRTVSLTSAC